MNDGHIVLNWSEFEENIPNIFRNLLNDVNFTDVTLVPKGGHRINAHKVILSHTSKFFQDYFRGQCPSQSFGLPERYQIAGLRPHHQVVYIFGKSGTERSCRFHSCW